MTFTGAVLCGGASRRMGQDKAQLVVDGTPMAVRVAETLWAAGAVEVRAVGGEVESLAALGLEAVVDELPGEGPLAATITAIRTARHPIVVVMACDLLRPSPTAVSSVVEALGDAPSRVVGAVPVSAGRHQWAHAAWRAEALAGLQAAFTTGVRSLRGGADSLPLVEVQGLDPANLADADAPADLLSSALSSWAQGHGGRG